MAYLVFCNTCSNFSKECLKRDENSKFVSEGDSCSKNHKLGDKNKGYFKVSCKDYENKN